MKNEIGSKLNYSPPEIEILEISLQKGYLLSSQADAVAGQWEDGVEEGSLSDF